MLSKWQWLWAQLTTTLWIRACLFGVFGVVAALIGSAADQWSEIDFPISVAQETVDQILEIMANSMLMVTTFIGAFLFSLVGLIATKTEVYQANGRFVLFVFTLLMIVFIVVAIFRWIEHLTVLGRVGSTSAKVEDATSAALQFCRQHPCLGARRFEEHFEPADYTTRIDAKQVG